MGRRWQGLIPIDSGAQEDKVGPKHGLDQGQGDGSSLVNHQQLSLCQRSIVLRLDVLHCLQDTAPHTVLVASRALPTYLNDMHFTSACCQLPLQP